MTDRNENVAQLAQLLKETSIQHGSFEAVAPPHDWWDWYAAYMVGRQNGDSEKDATAFGDQYMADVKGVVVPPEALSRR